MEIVVDYHHTKYHVEKELFESTSGSECSVCTGIFDSTQE
jgi:hypothetical protein